MRRLPSRANGEGKAGRSPGRAVGGAVLPHGLHPGGEVNADDLGRQAAHAKMNTGRDHKSTSQTTPPIAGGAPPGLAEAAACSRARYPSEKFRAKTGWLALSQLRIIWGLVKSRPMWLPRIRPCRIQSGWRGSVTIKPAIGAGDRDADGGVEATVCDRPAAFPVDRRDASRCAGPSRLPAVARRRRRRRRLSAGQACTAASPPASRSSTASSPNLPPTGKPALCESRSRLRGHPEVKLA